MQHLIHKWGTQVIAQSINRVRGCGAVINNMVIRYIIGGGGMEVPGGQYSGYPSGSYAPPGASAGYSTGGGGDTAPGPGGEAYYYEPQSSGPGGHAHSGYQESYQQPQSGGYGRGYGDGGYQGPRR